jgi:hypothetical protein
MSLLSQFAEDEVREASTSQPLPDRIYDEPLRPDGPSILEDLPTKNKRRADYSNDERLNQMDVTDANLIGKLGGHYLLPDPNSFTPDPIWGPYDSFTTPSWFREWIAPPQSHC